MQRSWSRPARLRHLLDGMFWLEKSRSPRHAFCNRGWNPRSPSCSPGAAGPGVTVADAMRRSVRAARPGADRLPHPRLAHRPARHHRRQRLLRRVILGSYGPVAGGPAAGRLQPHKNGQLAWYRGGRRGAGLAADRAGLAGHTSGTRGGPRAGQVILPARDRGDPGRPRGHVRPPSRLGSVTARLPRNRPVPGARRRGGGR